MRAKKDINQRIGANIKAVREEARYTQEQLSEMIGVTPNHLSAVERGISGASLELLEKLCKLFGVGIDRLFFGVSEQEDYIAETVRKMERVSPEQRRLICKIVTEMIKLTEIDVGR